MNLTREITKTPIVALTLQGVLVNNYESIAAASRDMNIETSRITANIVGRTVRTGQYLFIAEDVYDPTQVYTYESLLRKKKFRKQIKANLKLKL